MQIDEYLRGQLDKAGYANIEIHKTPMGHRIIIHAVRLGMVIGKRGRNIRRLTEDLEHLFGLESPQLEVRIVSDPELNAKVMANRLIGQIQRGFHFRRAGYSLLRRIMANGARGCEIIVKGKLTSQRARSEAFREGFVAKCGEPAYEFVDVSVESTALKQGVIGVHVKIMKPDAILPDEATFYPTPFPDEEIEEVTEEEELLEEDTDLEELEDLDEDLEEALEDAPDEEPEEGAEESPAEKPEEGAEESPDEEPEEGAEDSLDDIASEEEE